MSAEGRRPQIPSSSSSPASAEVLAPPRPLRAEEAGDIPAKLFHVLGRSGRLRGMLVVTCPYCENAHQHAAPPWFTEGGRRAACGVGYYHVVVRGGGRP